MSKKNKPKTTVKQPWFEMTEAQAKRLPGTIKHVHTYSTISNARRKANQIAGGGGQVVIAVSEESKDCSVLINHREKATAQDVGEAMDASQAHAAKEQAKKTASEAEPKRIGVLDAAAEILAKSKNAMSCKRIVELAIETGRWTTTGKTPHATLYSAIIREIAKKGEQARFRKIDRGRFAFNAAQAA